MSPIVTANGSAKGPADLGGAAHTIAYTLTTVHRLREASTAGQPGNPSAPPKPLLRVDSAYFGYPSIGAALRGGADVSITIGQTASGRNRGARWLLVLCKTAEGEHQSAFAGRNPNPYRCVRE